LHKVIVQLLYEPEYDDDSDSDGSTPSQAPRMLKSSPAERYHDLSPDNKISILWFMVNVAVSSKAIHAHIEASEEQLTTLRKEKIELGRSKKGL
jgi:bromodomain adjacent to zinc finger domain protein 1A